MSNTKSYTPITDDLEASVNCINIGIEKLTAVRALYESPDTRDIVPDMQNAMYELRRKLEALRMSECTAYTKQLHEEYGTLRQAMKDDNKSEATKPISSVDMIGFCETEIAGVADELTHLLAGDDALRVVKLEKSRMLHLLKVIADDCQKISNSVKELNQKE